MVFCLVVFAMGCGAGAIEAATQTEASSSSTDGDGSSTGGDGSSTDDDGSTDEGTSTDGDTTDGDTTDGDTTDGDTTGGEPLGPITYCSDAFVGAYDRVNLWRRDKETDTCTLIRIIAGNGWDGPTVEINSDMFTVEKILQQSGADQCATNTEIGVVAVAAGGAITLHFNEMGLWKPDAVDVDATSSFAPTEPWIVSEVVFEVVGLVSDYSCDDPSDWVEGT